MGSKEVIRLLHERGLKITSASSSIPNIYASALIEELGNSAAAAAVVIEGAAVEAVEEGAEEESAETDHFTKNSPQTTQKEIVIPTENIPSIATEKLKDSPASGAVEVAEASFGGNFGGGSDLSDGISQEKQGNTVVANAYSAPIPKKFIKIPLPQAPKKTPMIFVADAAKAGGGDTLRAAEVEEKVSAVGAATVVEKEAESVTTAAAASSGSGAGAVRSRPAEAGESTSRAAPRKAPPVNFKEKRAAPTVRFQFKSREQRDDSPFNAIKIPGPADATDPKDSELKTLVYRAPLILRDFAQKLGLKPFQLISELMRRGIFASINQQIADDVATSVAAKYGFKLEIRQKTDGAKANVPKAKVVIPKELLPRPPVVCILGHVDHGKTTLLDTIRHANVVAREAGGITQHVDAYQVEHEGKKITFLDTPGHAAFANMRERGANITDIAILVVAADDGFMPQTDEALKFAQKAEIPIVVAINKIDAKGANVDRVKQQMQQRGIAPEEWGGDTLCMGISALKGTHVDELLSLVLLQAEIMELRADYKCPAVGIVIEAQVDIGRGAAATVIIREGTLKVGDAMVCGQEYCRVRSMLDEHLKAVKVATPAMAMKIIGWSGIPEVGDVATVVSDEKAAKRQSEENRNEARRTEVEPAKIADVKTLFEAMASQKQKILKIIVKCDVHGTREALVDCLNTIRSSKVKLEVLSSGVGAISQTDIEFASSSEAIIVGFGVKMDSGAAPLAKNKGVRVILHNIIYELIDRVREEMAELLDYEYTENHLGTAEVRQIFHLARAMVAGCMVTEGQIMRDKSVRVRRGNKILFEGGIDSLRRQKEDQMEVRSGFECGIKVNGFSAFEIGDTIESFEMVRHRQTL
jgi:translation initiation factor IF-2